MDKTIYTHKQKLGEHGEAEAKLGVNGENLRVEVSATAHYEKPISEIAEPILKVADSFVDKIEALIPGDQKAMAAAAKADFRKAVVDGLKGLAPEIQPQVEAPAQA